MKDEHGTKVLSVQFIIILDIRTSMVEEVCHSPNTHNTYTAFLNNLYYNIT